MDRSTIHALFRAGKSKHEIARLLGIDRSTVRRALKEAIDKTYEREGHRSAVEPYTDEIRGWLKQKMPVRRMLESAQAHPERPYTGGKSVFYAYVRQLRQEAAQASLEAIVRFEGLPGEFLQVDWGEWRGFSLPDTPRDRRYFFCARLKYSRFMYVEFTRDMQLETLIRCHLRAFAAVGGVPWMVVYDNMKTVTLGRDDANQPIWNPTFFRFATEVQFHPLVCTPGAPRQKGAVESLVKYVKSNFLPGRQFQTTTALVAECAAWLDRVNAEPSQATGRPPVELLAEERSKFTPLAVDADAYGVAEVAVVGPDSCVLLETNRYSVPVNYVGRGVLVRRTAREVLAFDDATMLARHARCFGRGQRIVELAHLEPAVAKKPRGRAMLYRTHLLGLHPTLAAYVAEVCRRHVTTMDAQILALHALWQRHGTDEVVAAAALAGECGTFAAEYLDALLAVPAAQRKIVPLRLAGVPSQDAIDRQLTTYESYVR